MSEQITTRRHFQPLAALCLLLLLAACGGEATQPAQTITSSPAATPDCTTLQDSDVVESILEKIKTDEQFNDQMNHINVSCREQEVTLDGWAKGEEAVATLEQYAKETACVSKVTNNLSPVMKVGCGPGQIVCGGTCIDKDADCNIRGR